MQWHNIMRWILVAWFLQLCFYHTKAQVLVSKGSTHVYSVMPLSASDQYLYHWSASGGTSSIFGTLDTTNQIVWDGPPGVYTISVYPEKAASSCYGDTQNLSVRVVTMNVVWLDTFSTQCPNTDNQSGNFSITASYTGIAGAWSFSYSIDGTDTVHVNVSSGNYFQLLIPGFRNVSNVAAANHSIRIVSVTTPDHYTVDFNGLEPDAATRLYRVTVEPTPGTSGIIQL
jgi:hypothetical protein